MASDGVTLENGPDSTKKIRALYSFPHRLGASRICYTAWQQVNGLAAAGVELLLFPGSLTKPVPDGVTVRPTLALGRVRLPYKVLGSMRAFALHDYIVSRRLERMGGQVDIVHTWPLGALRTLRVAARLGIPTVLERANANTRFAYEVVQQECDRLGVSLPADHEHAYNEEVLRIEEEEYQLADRLLCASDFSLRTFADRGYSAEKLARHIYGVDENVFYPATKSREPGSGLTALFVGVAAVRKGLHYALDAWLKSSAHKNGTFMIAGEVLPDYGKVLSAALAHPSVHALGHRNDVPELMRNSDVLILPTIEEGFGLVCTEAMASGCVPLVSDACTDICRHLENALVHSVGDVAALTQHLDMVAGDRTLLEGLKAAGLRKVPEITWTAAGCVLLEVYKSTIAMKTAQAV